MQFKLVRITLLTLALTVLTSVGHAQQLNPLQRQIAQQGKQQERQYKQYMAITVDNLDRLCKLTDPQKKKLAIASKGAVERTMGKWKRQMVQVRGQFGGQFGGNFDVVAEALVEEAEPAIADDGDDAVEAPAEADPDAIEIEIAIEEGDFVNDVQIMAPAIAWNGPFVGMGGMNVNAINSVAKEPVWTKAVAKTLTDKQKADFKQAQTKRRQFRRKSAVDNVIAKIDSELILSDDQRTKIGELVNKAVGHQFSMQQNGFTMDFSQANGMTAVQRIPMAQMAKLLSKTQMARWNEFRRQYGAPEQAMPGNLLNWRNILGGFGLQ